MPIRTNRGRAAALRRLWGWPMRSTRHLLSAALAMVTVVLATGGIAAGSDWLGSSQDQHQPAPHASAPSSTEAPSPSPSEAPSSETEEGSTSPRPSQTPSPREPGRAAHDPRAAKTAVAFAETFAHHPPEMPHQEWVKRVEPHVMPESRGLLGTIDPRSLDVNRVVDPPQVSQAGDAVARVTVPTDTHPLSVRVVQVGGQWQVRSWGGE